jgi:uncharacterized membrane protein YqjE
VNPPTQPGLLGAARAVAACLVDIGQTRLQLASTELEEERLRLVELLLWAIGALFFLGIGLVLAALLLVLVFWDGPRVLVLAIVTIAILALAAGMVVALRRKARAKPPLLAATLAELRRDRDALLGTGAER